MKKTVLVVTDGDARVATTWSGVPSNFVAEAERQGAHCICVNIAKHLPSRILSILFNRIVRRIFMRGQMVSFEQTRLSMWLRNHWVRGLVKRFKSVDYVVVFSFWFDSREIGCPCILIHDWTSGYAQKVCWHKERLGYWEERFESLALNMMRSSHKVVSLYPKVIEYLKDKGVVNSEFICNPIPQYEITRRDSKSVNRKSVLCVGGQYYRENVETVLNAVEILGDRDISVDVVGLDGTGFTTSVNVKWHGYLNKSIPEHAKIYNELFARAGIFVNVRSGWGGGTSVAEALSKGVPVIVGDYPDIVGQYGDAKFGAYCETKNPVALAKELRRIFSISNDVYSACSRAAVEVTRGCTFERFVKGVFL